MYIFGITTNRILIKTVNSSHLTCPACQRQGQLQIKLFQIEIDGALKRKLDKIEAEANCQNCGKTLQEKEFTAELKQVVADESKNIKLVTSTQLGTLGKRALAIALGCFILAGGIFLANSLGLLQGGKSSVENELENAKLYVAEPKVGDICKALAVKNGQTAAKLFKVVEVDKANNKITLVAHAKENAGVANWDNLAMDDSQFTGEKETFSLKDFSNRRIAKDGEKTNEIMSVYSVIRK